MQSKNELKTHSHNDKGVTCRLEIHCILLLNQLKHFKHHLMSEEKDSDPSFNCIDANIDKFN